VEQDESMRIFDKIFKQVGAEKWDKFIRRLKRAAEKDD
jgi:hypothetical protein